MAMIHPPLSTLHPTSAGAYRERDILGLLEQGLPDGFDVFHNVDWSTLRDDKQTFGELDAVVVAPGGHVMLLEVKAGPVSLFENALVKSYADTGGYKTKNLEIQSRRQHGAMLDRLAKEGLSAVFLGHFLVLADHAVTAGTVAYPRERIIDAKQLNSMCGLIKAALQKDALPESIRSRVMDFWANRFNVYPNASTLMGQTQRANIALADGLATWVPRIAHTGGVTMIEATAGSGKSQLALTLLRATTHNQIRGAYICYNRPLADHMVQVMPPSVEVSTFHEYCVTFSRNQGIEPDFSAKGVYEELSTRLMDKAATQAARLDILVIDESQDFDANWVQALLPRLKESGRLYILGDSDQKVYPRDEFCLPDAVHVRCMDNFRSPRKIVQAINQFELTTEPVQARSVYRGQSPGFHTYADDGKNGVDTLETCLHELLNDGISPKEIAVVTFSGRERSEVLNRNSLAGLSLKQFSGQYDEAGNPVWSSGDLLVETLYRFKGQSAPVVVLCEIDFSEISVKERRKLFVGFSRAQFRLECVLSERAASLLGDRI